MARTRSAGRNRRQKLAGAGRKRLQTPVDRSWDTFFAGAAVSDDFFSERPQPAKPIRAHQNYFRERRARANPPEALAILKRAGAGNPPMKGDEMPKRRRR